LQVHVLDEQRDETLFVFDLHRIERTAIGIDADQEVVLFGKTVKRISGHDGKSASNF
jgi:hypothetical protein